MSKRDPLPRVFISVILCLFLASVAHAEEPDELIDCVYLPGNSNQMRWDFLKDKLQLLCKSNKAQVKKLLGVGACHCSEQKDIVIWAYRVTSNLSKEAFTDVYYELLISLNKDKVSSVEIHLERERVGYSASEGL